MAANLKNGDHVRLVSFHGTTDAPNGTDPSENYWQLIGKAGVVVSNQMRSHPAFISLGSRLLIRFDKDLKLKGLHCHNDIDNTLWIFEIDLLIQINRV